MQKQPEIERELKNQAQGADTQVMVAVGAALLLAIFILFVPWLSIPILKFTKFPWKFKLWQFPECIEGIQYCAGEGQKLEMEALSPQLVGKMTTIIYGLWALAAVTVVLLIVFAVFAYMKKGKAAGYGRFVFGFTILLPVSVFIAGIMANMTLNEAIGRANSFTNLTVQSYIQLTPYPYAQILIAIGMVVGVFRLLDTKREDSAQSFMTRSIKEDNRLSKRTIVATVIILILIPFVIFFGIYFLNDRSYYFIALCIVFLSMVPFFMVFESRRPQAREILLIAVLSAIAIVGRAAFFMIPQFKPVTAIVIIAGLSFGAEAGFLTGAISGFVSNFFFGQGPWTPWQMFAFGIIGFLAGLIFRGKRGGLKYNRAVICTFGGIATLVIYGLIMDTASVFMFTSKVEWKRLLATYISGFPFNVIHGVSTVVFLFFLTKPMLRKLDRIKKKYGILDP